MPLTAARQKIASMQAGHDDDAALKTWLTGVPLERRLPILFADR